MAVVKQASPAARPRAPTETAGNTVPSSSTSLPGRSPLFCIACIFVHNTHMPPVAILGRAGYTGQETLDRVLTHPERELVALGSETLAGRPARALDPRLDGGLPVFSHNDEAASAG